MQGDTKLDRTVRYGFNIIIVICVYTLLFEVSILDAQFFYTSSDNIVNLLCVISGVPPSDLLLEIPMVKWMLAISVVFTLVGREVYDQQNNLKYIAMIRYGSYRRFYQGLMNITVINVLIYGSIGTLTTYALYIYKGYGQVSNIVFAEIYIIYLSQLLLLCLLQTLCMILTQGYTTSILLLLLWFLMVMFGHLTLRSAWSWLPANWGMYLRWAKVLPGGVKHTAYYLQAGMCFLLWLGIPLIVRNPGYCEDF